MRTNFLARLRDLPPRALPLAGPVPRGVFRPADARGRDCPLGADRPLSRWADPRRAV